MPALFLFLWLGSTTKPVFSKVLLNDENTLSEYPDHEQMRQRLEKLAGAQPELSRLTTLAQSAGGKPVHLLTIGAGDTQNRPALAIVGGVSGDHLLGSELALQFAEILLAKSGEAQIRQLLDSVTFYVFPDMSPDARSQYFADLRYERLYNNNIIIRDRTADPDKPPFIDLNGDGMITMMRIKDPAGSWITHPDDERVMVKARSEKGERGEYRLYREGLRADRHGRVHNDDVRGVVFDRNFTFQYPAFQPGAGPHAVSETETRAIADFLFDAKNVYAVITFGDANNLSEPLTYNEQAASARIHTGWKRNDIAINEMISQLYRKHVGDDLPKASQAGNGDFSQWAYYHYGRFSFSTPGWTLPETETDTPDPYNSKELRFLRWAESNEITDVVVPWTEVAHPDFPDQPVEVGGIFPFAMKNPPYEMVADLARKHTDFILDVAALRPVIDIVRLEKETLGRDLHRVTAHIMNKGSFPTASQTGEILRWKQKTVIRTTLDDGQQMVSGKPIEVLGAIEGRSAVTRSWLIHGRGNVSIVVGAESSGFSEKNISL